MKLFKLSFPSVSTSKTNFFIKNFIPVLTAVILLIIIVLINFNQSKRLSKQNSLQSMEAFSSYCESSIKNIIKNCNILEYDSDIYTLLDTSESFSTYDYQKARNFLNNFVTTNNTVYSAAIINRSKDEVLSADGLYSFTQYFNENFILSGYKDTYWSNFRIYDAVPYKILPPIMCEYKDSHIPVIPVIFKELVTEHNNYLLITLSLPELTQNGLPMFSFPEGSELYILNKYTGVTLNITNNFTSSPLSGTDMYNKIMKGTNTFDLKDSKNNKSVLFSFSPNNKILSYTYYTIIPYSVINKSQFPNILISSLILLILLITTLIITNKNVNDYYTPIEKIENVLKKNIQNTPGKDKNHVHTIANAVYDVVSKYNKIENILPFAQEQYLIRYLNDSVISFDNSQTNTELLSSLPFSKNNFAVIIIQLSPTKKLFETFSQYEYENIFLGFFNIIRNIYSKAFNSFFLSVERESMYVIINTDEKHIDDKLNEISNSVRDLLKYDSEFVELYIVNGDLCESMDGLKKSYSQALKKLSGIPIVSPKTISASNRVINTNLFSSENELNLLNMLIVADVDSATELVINMTNQYKYNEEALIRIYHKILAVIFKAMYIKNIELGDKEQSEFEFYFELFNETPNMLYKKIIMLLGKFRIDNVVSDADISNEISRIITEKYHDSSLSLDTLADELNINKRTLSAQIKKLYNISFHSYLENIRIEKAKVLLLKTNKSVQSIYEETGFTNKQTFIRSFKKITGYTPSNYRQSSK